MKTEAGSAQLHWNILIAAVRWLLKDLDVSLTCCKNNEVRIFRNGGGI